MYSQAGQKDEHDILNIWLRLKSLGDSLAGNFNVHVVVSVITNCDTKISRHSVVFPRLEDGNALSWGHRQVHCGPIHLKRTQRGLKIRTLNQHDSNMDIYKYHISCFSIHMLRGRVIHLRWKCTHADLPVSLHFASFTVHFLHTFSCQTLSHLPFAFSLPSSISPFILLLLASLFYSPTPSSHLHSSPLQHRHYHSKRVHMHCSDIGDREPVEAMLVVSIDREGWGQSGVAGLCH